MVCSANPARRASFMQLLTVLTDSTERSKVSPRDFHSASRASISARSRSASV
ncbi:hypothetical protein D9M69_719970 [compost metagenome]